jgi:hypothetical protein
LKAGEGGWIIINDRIFTTSNKENKTLPLHPPSDFFSFFSLQIPVVFPLSSRLIFGAAPHFYCLILKGAAGSMKGKKRASLSSN